ncbi:unnamed protein product [Strongylus vulgaris]|uniref:Uncharacterized protein n=1 Tax=Strongylus vulgaris TaxID=40348 RepID=A0A3P7JG84_STRVU|nr:unnamed protein product [Strongylus vulgaris]
MQLLLDLVVHLQTAGVTTCCYGDFMRPLGYAPLLDYLNEGKDKS